MLTETIFCGGTSIFPVTFKIDEILFFSSCPVSMVAFFNCASVMETKFVFAVVSEGCSSFLELHPIRSTIRHEIINIFFIFIVLK